MTIIIPWIAFLAAVAWIVVQGKKAKDGYERRKAEEKIQGDAEKDRLLEALKSQIKQQHAP